ncbi:histidine kinase [Thermodesulfobacteriota bacterium]
MEAKTAFTKQLQALEDKIRELKKRMPAHSVKPGMMMELITLEDKRDAVLAQIRSIESQTVKD